MRPRSTGCMSMPRHSCCGDLRQGGGGKRTQPRQRYREHGIHLNVVEPGELKQLPQQSDREPDRSWFRGRSTGDEYSPILRCPANPQQHAR
jgi:hypothetical protein